MPKQDLDNSEIDFFVGDISFDLDFVEMPLKMKELSIAEDGFYGFTEQEWNEIPKQIKQQMEMLLASVCPKLYLQSSDDQIAWMLLNRFSLTIDPETYTNILEYYKKYLLPRTLKHSNFNLKMAKFLYLHPKIVPTLAEKMEAVRKEYNTFVEYTQTEIQKDISEETLLFFYDKFDQIVIYRKEFLRKILKSQLIKYLLEMLNSDKVELIEKIEDYFNRKNAEEILDELSQMFGEPPSIKDNGFEYLLSFPEDNSLLAQALIELPEIRKSRIYALNAQIKEIANSHTELKFTLPQKARPLKEKKLEKKEKQDPYDELLLANKERLKNHISVYSLLLSARFIPGIEAVIAKLFGVDTLEQNIPHIIHQTVNVTTFKAQLIKIGFDIETINLLINKAKELDDENDYIISDISLFNSKIPHRDYFDEDMHLVKTKILFKNSNIEVAAIKYIEEIFGKSNRKIPRDQIFTRHHKYPKGVLQKFLESMPIENKIYIIRALISIPNAEKLTHDEHTELISNNIERYWSLALSKIIHHYSNISWGPAPNMRRDPHALGFDYNWQYHLDEIGIGTEFTDEWHELWKHIESPLDDIQQEWGNISDQIISLVTKKQDKEYTSANLKRVDDLATGFCNTNSNLWILETLHVKIETDKYTISPSFHRAKKNIEKSGLAPFEIPLFIDWLDNLLYGEGKEYGNWPEKFEKYIIEQAYIGRMLLPSNTILASHPLIKQANQIARKTQKEQSYFQFQEIFKIEDLEIQTDMKSPISPKIMPYFKEKEKQIEESDAKDEKKRNRNRKDHAKKRSKRR